MIDLAITGAAGRMGQRLIALGRQDASFNLVAAVERPDHPMMGRDAGEIAGVGAIGLPITSELAGPAQVVIDFTCPAATRHWLRICQDRGLAMVIGTTGLDASDHASIDRAAAFIPVLQSPNMSLGVNLLLQLVGPVARMLGQDCDIEILEAHHRFKKDAPSGTALALAEAILAATGKTRDALRFGRSGEDASCRTGVIGIHALRLGDEVGRHTTCFATLGERLELTHVATSRDTFVRGALQAARWLAGRKPGRYKMADLLGLVSAPGIS